LHDNSAFDRALLDAINYAFVSLLGVQGAITVEELMELKSHEEIWVLAKNPDTLARLMEEIFGKRLSLRIERMIIKSLAEKLKLDYARTSHKNFADALQFLRESIEGQPPAEGRR
jgi:hypothetical protein